MSAGHLPQVGQSGRYVVLRHCFRTVAAESHSETPAPRHRGEHYDWMFAVDGVLLTWASEQWLAATVAAGVAALQLPPHRLAYLDYEGEVSGDRGTVQRVEAGTHRLLQAAADRYEFAVQGGRTGVMMLYRTASSDSWTIAFAP